MQGLIIDDDIIQHYIWQICLRDLNVTITAANTAYEGLHEAAAKLHDFFVIDFVLPDMEGLNLIALMKENEHLRAKPIILTTSSLDPEVQQLAMAYEVLEFICKPVSREKIREVYEKVNARLSGQ